MNELAHGEMEVLGEDGEFVLSRVANAEGRPSWLMVSPVLEQPAPAIIAKLERTLALREDLDASWAARPVELARFRSRLVLVVEDPGGTLLEKVIGESPGVPSLLRLAIGMARAIGRLHARGLVHRDIKPANFLVNAATGEAWLLGFGFSSRLPRQRQAPEPPEIIAGTLAYMAPEQTGRMNRSVDSRSDLYSFGVTLYEMVTGSLPFTAGDPMEWVHCHIAREPIPPCSRCPGFPEPISAIVMKLMAKEPEARYQTAVGVEADLAHCVVAWESQGRIDPFPLGSSDAPDQLLIPEKLYGREHEIARLLAAFDRVATQATTELVLVSGYSGAGKSSVVNELHKAIVPPRGLFASGKFDQFQRDIPYATLTQAFRTLVCYVLGRSDGEIARWREALQASLGQNGQLIVDLIPELEIITGKQTPVAALPPQEAQSRFQAVFRRFLAVFAQAEHPLVLFLDDLQWLDSATLRLLPSLITEPDIHHLLLVGAYRDNEVDSSHPLSWALATSREVGASVQELQLKPLAQGDIAQLMADGFHCDTERVWPLAQLVNEKTGGNPFFTIQFVTTLAEEGLLTFKPENRRWEWELSRIRSQAFTDNVIDLMSGKVDRLPTPTRRALSRFACLGNTAEAARLAVIHGGTEETLHAALWEALHAGFVSRSDSAYAFVHDRVQEAAYRLIPAEEQAEVHLEIGRILAAQTAPHELSGKIFDIVPHFNRGASLLSSLEERSRVASLNLLAGKRAKAAGAHGSALTYLGEGLALLTADRWEQQYQLTFELELHRAECELLTGEHAAAAEHLFTLARRARNGSDQAAVACLQMNLYMTLDRADQAIEVGLGYLRLAGIVWSAHPTGEEVSAEIECVLQQLGSRPVETLLELPLMSDPDCRNTLDVLTSMQGPSHFTDGNLRSLIVCRMVTLSLEHGNAAGSCYAYVYFGMILESQFSDYRRGLSFGRVGFQLSDREHLNRFRPRVHNNFGTAISPWADHVRTSAGILRRSNEAAHEMGDVTFAGYSYCALFTARLIAGDLLSEVQVEVESALAFVRRARFGTAIDLILPQLGLIRALRGLTSGLSEFNLDVADEEQFVRHLETDPGSGLPACWYWIRKLQASYLASDPAAAIEAANRAEAFLWTSPGYMVMADYHFYSALVRVAQHEESSPADQPGIWCMVEAHRKMLSSWMEHCPENFTNRVRLVEAEVARITRRPLEAMELFEQAIQSAQEHGFVQNEGLANELAARFYAQRGFETIAGTYRKNARYCYLRWGADGKVRHLERLYPHLVAPERQFPVSVNVAIGTLAGRLDAESVAKASQALSSEILLPKLIERLLQIAVEHAGAERGLLILMRGNEPQIEAEATTGPGGIEVAVRDTRVAPSDLPQSVLYFVIRTQTSVLLDDASADNVYSKDEYVRQKRSKSVLCLPIVTQAKLAGILYLENNLAPGAFTPSRVTVLQLLASQAAISLENAALYNDLKLQYGPLQHLPISAWTLQPDGTPDFVNQFWLEYAGQTIDYVRSHPEAWMAAVHPEDREVAASAFWEGVSKGQDFAMETRNRRAHDGTYRWMLNRAVVLRDTEGKVLKFVGTTIDLDDQKRAQDALRQAQAELAHVTRVTTMGELAASIAHEVNQPIAGVVLNANACLRWLTGVKGDSAKLSEARAAIQRIIRDGIRAGEVISRIRALFKKTELARESLDINETIREIIVLARSDMDKQRVALRMELAPELPKVLGDRVQLQQVMLNLILNAIDAMATVQGQARDLVIETRRSEETEVAVTVRDSGVGLVPESIEHIFTAFHTTKPGGLGMGLSISRSIVENHSGRLWATANESPGASFHFTLPTLATNGTRATP